MTTFPPLQDQTKQRHNRWRQIGARLVRAKRVTQKLSGIFALVSLSAFLWTAASLHPGPGIVPAIIPASPAHSRPPLPLAFEPNVGQTASTVRFLAHDKSGTVYFTPSQVVFSFAQAKPGTAAAETDGVSLQKVTHSIPPRESSVLHLEFVGANTTTFLSGTNPLPGRVNYFVGNDPKKWRTNVLTFAGVVCSELYPGVELSYGGGAGHLKGTYRVDPGADPLQIKWRYRGANHIATDAEGNLRIHLSRAADDSMAVAMEKAPIAWQEIDGRRSPVEVQYQVSENEEVSFAVGVFDHAYPLIIDPALVYSTYLGGNGLDTGYGLAVDATGNTYVTGITGSSNFPVANAYQQDKPGNFNAFVSKLSADGSTLLYSTYLGGNNVDVGESLAIDTLGNVYVTGYTQSTDFPIVNGYQAANAGSADVFVAKLSADGASLLYSTYLGGAQFDRGLEIAVDGENNMDLTGFTGSSDFPISNAFDASKGVNGDDAFVTKLNPEGSALVFSTFLGGSNGPEVGEGLAIDASGNVYVCGITASDDFPTKNAAQPVLLGTAGVLPTGDAFVTKLTADGSQLVYSTFLGGIDGENAQSIAVDSAGNAYVTGLTRSANFPVTPLAFQPTYGGSDFDAFVTKFNADGTIGYSTFLGGSGVDIARNLTVDAAGQALVTGETSSANFPTANPVQSTYAGGTIEGKDAFVTQLNAAGSALVFSTFLGGSGDDYGGDIVAVGADLIFVSGYTNSNNFPSGSASYQPSLAGGVDAFVTKISKQASPTPTPTPTPTATPSPTPSREKCDFPGPAVATDPSGDQDGGPVANQHLDIQAIYFAEPYIPEFDEPDFLSITMKVASLPSRPPNTIWRVIFTAPDATRHFAQMRTSATGTQPAYEYGHIDDSNPEGVVDGLAQTGVNMADGTIRIYVLNSQVGGPVVGQTLTGIGGFTRTEVSAGPGPIAQVGDSAGGNGTYQLVGNYFCRPQTAPIPVLSASPTSGSAPLDVAFDASGSFDQDADTIVTYTFDFDDGTSVNQSTPTITHSYTSPNNYQATVRVTDGRGLTSPNGAKAVVSVQPPTSPVALSRKSHGEAGPFNINLPLTGPPGIECRSGGANKDYQIVVLFPSAITCSNIVVTSGTGSVTNFSGNGSNAFTINLTGVTSAQSIAVTLFGLNDGSSANDLVVPMRNLVGDTTGNGIVSNADVSTVKAQVSTTVTTSTFRSDVNASGAISNVDVNETKAQVGASAP
jgi:hypothetical protein